MIRFLLAALVSTLIGTGARGYSDLQVNNPYGMAIGPDGALYFCDLDNQRIRRLDLKTNRWARIVSEQCPPNTLDDSMAYCPEIKSIIYAGSRRQLSPPSPRCATG